MQQSLADGFARCSLLPLARQVLEILGKVEQPPAQVAALRAGQGRREGRQQVEVLAPVFLDQCAHRVAIRQW